MSSNIDIQKKCKWCGEVFTAHKMSTAYCSHKCANLAYKERVRKERISAYQKELSFKEYNEPLKDLEQREFFTPTTAAKLLGISRATIYRYLADETIKAVQFKGKTLIRRKDIDMLFESSATYNKRLPQEKAPITEFYTTAEVKEKYNVVDSWIFVVAKKHNIPRTFNRGKTYWSKKHIDNYFGKKAADPEITEWYSVQEIQDKFGMSLAAIYTLASKNAVPKKKEGVMVSYSKKHFDIAKGIAQPDEPQYYTVAEAMAKFNLTRDQLYHYAKYHNIPRVKVGKYVKISRPELDKLFEAPKIE
ncbi:helix-turn-helix domain-containing protein [Bacteroides uniformis]|uniref:Helix-turn-helix domain-containing protein n=2 Tax=Bacteroides uniformis TaxID=820 RepID=A0A6I0LE69_BACUN|nr:helix-turn-helix domain-containing protein [Bacteroides uniformis]KAB4244111.1 helix-turn-helix domain-containing protein [Bacteroides uniformis]KAB4247105.1 helix-turn-helix domain-containing protein [Bacteroides uniformis]KAB4247180.1 helix-turn-helix domain-containing protein [Bacteroides uniformis]KAB4257494.1 helix-turn-helix domain-containing protein [Bacteroides uniformis]